MFIHTFFSECLLFKKYPIQIDKMIFRFGCLLMRMWSFLKMRTEKLTAGLLWVVSRKRSDEYRHSSRTRRDLFVSANGSLEVVKAFGRSRWASGSCAHLFCSFQPDAAIADIERSSPRRNGASQQKRSSRPMPSSSIFSDRKSPNPHLEIACQNLHIAVNWTDLKYQ